MGWAEAEQRIKKALLGRLEWALARKQSVPGPEEYASVRSVLVVRQHDMYGDFLLATPVFRALRARFPQARIGACVRESFAELLHHTPEIDELIVVPRDRKQWSVGAFVRLWKEVRKGWDLIFVLNTVSHSLTSDLIPLFARPRLIVGSASPLLAGATRNFLYNVAVPLVPGVRHQTDRNMDIVRVVGAETADLSERITVTPAEEKEAEERLREAGYRSRRPLVGMHVGAGKIRNRWPAERFAALGGRVRELGGEVLLLWGPQEVDLKEAVLRAATHKPILIPPSSLRALAANLTCCDAVVCNDTGVMHLCASAGVPLVALFGPTSAAEWKPLGDQFVALQGDGESVESITVGEAFETLTRLLKRQGSRAQ